jgi:hypothetical protein
VKSADAMLLDYVEARERLASAPALTMTLHSGLITALLCERKRCIGSPRQNRNGEWRCSSCRRLWDLERVELGRTQIGGKVSMWGRDRKLVRTRSAARSPESRPHRVVRGYGPILDQLATEAPHAFAAWRLHVLDDREIRLGQANCLGLTLEYLPARMAAMVASGALPPCEIRITVYRVRQWIGFARRRAVEILEERVRRTVAAAVELELVRPQGGVAK